MDGAPKTDVCVGAPKGLACCGAPKVCVDPNAGAEAAPKAGVLAGWPNGLGCCCEGEPKMLAEGVAPKADPLDAPKGLGAATPPKGEGAAWG